MRRKIYLAFLFSIIVFWIHWGAKREIRETVAYLQLKTNYFPTSHYLLAPEKHYCDDKPLFVIVITSYAGHVELRSAHRRAFSKDTLNSMHIKRLFLLAAVPPHEKYITQEALQDEYNIYGDILQGSFIENYRYLTYKHVMGLQWVANMCHEASFVLKVDDDTVFNINKTYDLILRLNEDKELDRDNFLMGYMLNNTLPRRNKQNKWYVTWEEYPRSIYPQYLSGWYYITTPATALRIYEEVIHHQYFWIDDIFITGIITEALGIKLRHVPQHFWLQYYELLECCLKDVVTKSLQCDHVVGPNGGRTNLILEFNKIVQKCDLDKHCKPRSRNQDIHDSCVVSNNREIFGSGHPEIKSIKLL